MEKVKQELFTIADQLRSISNLGLIFSNNSFDTKRYNNILELCAKLYSKIEQENIAEITSTFKDHINHISPLAGADSVILKDQDILLIKRHDDNLWATPGGLIEIGETPKEAVLR